MFIGGFDMGVKLENIFYPDDAVRDQQRLLLDAYLEDYGEENRKLIQKRQSQTTCLFDSDPVVTKLFLEENIKKIVVAKQAKFTTILSLKLDR